MPKPLLKIQGIVKPRLFIEQGDWTYNQVNLTYNQADYIYNGLVKDLVKAFGDSYVLTPKVGLQTFIPRLKVID